MRRVGQQFPPRQGSNCPSGDIFFPWGLDSDITYAQVSTHPGPCTVSIEGFHLQ